MHQPQRSISVHRVTQPLVPVMEQRIIGHRVMGHRVMEQRVTLDSGDGCQGSEDMNAGSVGKWFHEENP